MCRRGKKKKSHMANKKKKRDFKFQLAKFYILYGENIVGAFAVSITAETQKKKSLLNCSASRDHVNRKNF